MIELHIEKLILNGFPHLDTAKLQKALDEHLNHLFTNSPQDHFNSPSLETAIASRIAEKIHKTITNGEYGKIGEFGESFKSTPLRELRSVSSVENHGIEKNRGNRILSQDDSSAWGSGSVHSPETISTKNTSRSGGNS